MRKKRGKAVSGSTAIHFNADNRRHIRALQKASGGVTLATVVKMALKEAYDRLMALQRTRRLAPTVSRIECSYDCDKCVLPCSYGNGHKVSSGHKCEEHRLVTPIPPEAPNA